MCWDVHVIEKSNGVQFLANCRKYSETISVNAPQMIFGDIQSL